MSEDKLTLILSWSKAKTLQIALAMAKNHVKENTGTMKEMLELEQALEEFTGTASLIIDY